MHANINSQEDLERFAAAVAEGHSMWAHSDTIAKMRLYDAEFADRFQPNEYIDAGTLVAVDMRNISPTYKRTDTWRSPWGPKINDRD